MTDPVFNAAALAARFHQGTIRKDGTTPYIAHPVRVALTIATLFDVRDPDVLAAALLHDVIEDTGADYDDIQEQCNREVADLVACLTKDMRMVEDDREPAYDAQLAAGSWTARLIKLADVYDNLSDAPDDASRRLLLGKARRAVDLARHDAELARATGLVEALMERIESELAGSS